MANASWASKIGVHFVPQIWVSYTLLWQELSVIILERLLHEDYNTVMLVVTFIVGLMLGTSILHHVLLLLFIMFLSIIMLFGVILMHFLSWLSLRNTPRGRIPAARNLDLKKLRQATYSAQHQMSLNSTRILSASWERGSPDLPTCGPRRGSTSGPVQPIFISKYSRPSRVGKPRKAHDTRPPKGQPH